MTCIYWALPLLFVFYTNGLLNVSTICGGGANEVLIDRWEEKSLVVQGTQGEAWAQAWSDSCVAFWASHYIVLSQFPHL